MEPPREFLFFSTGNRIKCFIEISIGYYSICVSPKSTFASISPFTAVRQKTVVMGGL